MLLSLKPATLIKRYKRFLADVILENGSEVTIHVANTGAMTGCAEPGDTIWYSTSDNPKRKYPYSWEITQTKQDHLICVNTMRANQLVEEALGQSTIAELQGYQCIQREVKYGNENSKVDFFLSQGKQSDAFVEVKSVTLLKEKQGYFPDAVTTRGQKHLRELSALRNEGTRTVLLFAVLHSGITSVSGAQHIDEKYCQLLAQAKQDGVEILAYKAEFTLTDKSITIELNTAIAFNSD